MKVIKFMLIGLFVLILLVLIGGYVFLQTFDVNKYRGEIAQQVSAAIGRDVAIERIGLNLSLFKGVYAELYGLRVGEHSSFGGGDFASVGSVKVGVDVLAYASQKEIVVTGVDVAGVKVNIIQNKGVINAQLIGPAGGGAADPNTGNNTAQQQAAAPIPGFSVKTIALRDVDIVYEDRGQTPPMKIAVSRGEITVKDFSLQRPFSFEGRAAVLGVDHNVSLKGQASIDMAALGVVLSGFELEFDLARLAIADLIKAVPALEAAGLSGKLAGKIKILIPRLSAGAAGLSDVDIQGQLADAAVTTSLLPVPMSAINAAFRVDSKDVYVDNYSLVISSGIIKGHAKISDYLGAMGLSANVEAQALPLGGLVAGLPEGMTLGGALNAAMSVAGQDLVNPEAFLSSLAGSGSFSVAEGKLENFNLLRTVLSRIDVIPGLAAAIEMSIPEQYRQDFLSDTTVFDKIASGIELKNGKVDLPDFVILSRLFEANMKISADTALNGKVGGAIKVPADLSAALASGAPALDYLRDGEGKLTLTLISNEGPLAQLKIMPDVKELGKVALEGEGKRQINRLLNKALGVDDPPPPAEGETTAPSAGEQIIGGVLNKFLR